MDAFGAKLSQLSSNSIDGLIANGVPQTGNRRGGGREVVAAGVVWSVRYTRGGAVAG